MYGEGRNWRFIIGFSLLAILLIVVIVLIMNSGGGKSGKVPETKRTLVSYAGDPDVTVSETIVGPVTADVEHHEVAINVSNRLASYQLTKGYNGNVVKSRDYGTGVASFSEFLSALDKAGFTKGSTDEELKNDAGYCSTGQRYIFEIKSGAAVIQRFWATSCSGPKSYKGNLGLTLDLFQAQIPDYDELTDDTDFSTGDLLL